MQRVELKQINPLSKRANCKITSIAERNFLIGGLTADTVTTEIAQFRIVQLQGNPCLQWKKVPMDKKLFSERNSFAICPVNNKIYIFGGNQIVGQAQKSLPDLIQFNTDTSKLSKLKPKNQFPIHSAALVYDSQTNSLISYGGTDQQSKLENFLCRLNLSDNQNLQWTKTRIQCKQHQGVIWQHSAHLIKRSIIKEGVQGKFLLIVGGCIQPFMPYKHLVEIDLSSNKVSATLELQQGIVSQDSVVVDDTLYIFGGSNGNGFNNTIYIVKNGKIEKQQGYTGLGCACMQLQQGILVYGGAKDGESFNGAYLYKQK